MEQALHQQIVTAIEPQYLEAFRETTTGRISLSVHELIRQLFRMYGRVTPPKLLEQEEKIRQMTYGPINPIDGIFTAIDDLVHYANAAASPYTQAQIVNMGYLILNRTGVFRRWILEWNVCTPLQKTWTNFKIHFRTAHHQLKETTSLQQHQSSFQVNAVKEFLHELKNELRNDVSVHPQQDDALPATTISAVSSESTSSTISGRCCIFFEIGYLRFF